MKTIGFGIIGIGRQGLRLAEHIRNDIKHAELVAVCRRSEAGHAYSKEHGIKFYSNHHDLLADKRVNAVIITTPSSLHGSQAIDALNAGKHLLIDKPVASTVKEGNKIVALAKKQKLTAALNFPLRVSPVTKTLKNHISSIGKLKKIQIIVSQGPPRSKWQSSLKLSNGGVILDLGSHYIDLISFLTKSRPKSVTDVYTERAENEHSGFIDLAYKGFSVSMVLLRNQKLKKNIIACAGDNGFVFADYSLREVIVSNNDKVEEIKCPPSHDFEAILNNFVCAIHKKESLIADAKAGINSLKTVLSVYEEIRTQKPIRS